MPKKKSYVERMGVPIDPELMKRLLKVIERMPEDQRRDFTGLQIGLIAYLDEEEKDVRDRATVLTSFSFRMQALTRLCERPEYRAWSMKLGSGEPDMIHEVLVEVAASEPLIEVDERPAFEPESFFRKALEMAETTGGA
jgi:hypothetical protein